ncbi:hypothetical protein VNO77_15451 [Canavalia gladiata]|uniref:Uncharacterized protein n=1 Tax=Canavalia gladiata TaxID=3824 RepID=A0AAN9QRD9_CANGL
MKKSLELFDKMHKLLIEYETQGSGEGYKSWDDPQIPILIHRSDVESKQNEEETMKVVAQWLNKILLDEDIIENGVVNPKDPFNLFSRVVEYEIHDPNEPQTLFDLD